MKCSNCKKQLTAGAYPNWVCLRSECDQYLNRQTREYYHYEKRPFNDRDIWKALGYVLLYMAAITAVIIAAFYEPS